MLRIIIKIIIAILASILILAGLGFFIGSLYLYLDVIFKNSTLAAFFCGLSVLLLAILLLLAIALWKGRSKRKNSYPVVDEVGKAIDDPIGLFKKYPLQTSIVGLAAGFIFGFSPKTRKALIETVVSYISEHLTEKEDK